jgi:hypothetical protein
VAQTCAKLFYRGHYEERFSPILSGFSALSSIRPFSFSAINGHFHLAHPGHYEVRFGPFVPASLAISNISDPAISFSTPPGHFQSRLLAQFCIRPCINLDAKTSLRGDPYKMVQNAALSKKPENQLRKGLSADFNGRAGFLAPRPKTGKPGKIGLFNDLRKVHFWR